MPRKQAACPARRITQRVGDQTRGTPLDGGQLGSSVREKTGDRIRQFGITFTVDELSKTVIDGCHGRCDFRITFRDGRSFSGYVNAHHRGLARSDSHQAIPAVNQLIGQPAFDVHFPRCRNNETPRCRITRLKGPNRAIIAGPTEASHISVSSAGTPGNAQKLGRSASRVLNCQVNPRSRTVRVRNRPQLLFGKYDWIVLCSGITRPRRSREVAGAPPWLSNCSCPGLNGGPSWQRLPDELLSSAVGPKPPLATTNSDRWQAVASAATIAS